MVESKHKLKAGTRVRLRSAHHTLDLSGDTGTIIGPDEWLDYYLVALDRPALYHHADGRTEELTTIREDVDNLIVLPPLRSP